MSFEGEDNLHKNTLEKRMVVKEISPEKQIENIVDAIDRMGLSDSCKDDPEQLKLLEENKLVVRKRISSIWKMIDDYMYLTSLIGEAKEKWKDYGDTKNFKFNFKDADMLKHNKHEALISELHSTIRFINNTFGNISEEAQEEWEDNLVERGLPILKAKRINFPKNVLCPDEMNLSDRDQIANWAVSLYKSTGKLKNGPYPKIR